MEGNEISVKAKTLVEAHQYIRAFSGKIVVVKVGGSIMDDPDALKSLLNDVCFLGTLGMKPIIVHGGGKAINAAMSKAGLEPHFVQGRRYTDERTLAIAEHVLVNDVNKKICETIKSMGESSMGLHSLQSCVVFGKRLFLADEAENGEAKRIDIGLVGEVEWVNAELLKALTQANVIPVIAPIARDASGGKLNINADSVAGHVAAAVQAEKLILVSDTHGIRKSDEAKDFASSLTQAEVDELVASGVISAGMLPKVEASFTALHGGVNKTQIVDGKIEHSILLEVYTDSGIGTEVVLDEAAKAGGGI